jgi:hypothetical protein
MYYLLGSIICFVYLIVDLDYFVEQYYYKCLRIDPHMPEKEMIKLSILAFLLMIILSWIYVAAVFVDKINNYFKLW